MNTLIKTDLETIENTLTHNQKFDLWELLSTYNKQESYGEFCIKCIEKILPRATGTITKGTAMALHGRLNRKFGIKQ